MDEWISITERKPPTGAACWVVWSGVVQLIAYRRTGHGYGCSAGYTWEQAYELGFEGIPDEEVTHWRPLPDPPYKNT